MPIRINLLAEQQAAEEARRKDPVKRAIIIGAALVALAVAWTLVTFMQVKAQRSEYVRLEAEFKSIDDKAKGVRALQAEVGDFERRLISLNRYSTNRILWASMLDALQNATMPQIRLKSVSANQRYTTNPPTVFFTTNIMVGFAVNPPAWKFWAGNPKPTDVVALAARTFGTFTNGGVFATNKLPYTVKMAVATTNLNTSEVGIKCEFTLPAVCSEDTEVLLAGGDYGNPPGAAIDEFQRTVENLPYFKARLTDGEDRSRFTERPPNPEPDLTQPNSPMFKRFTLRLKYADRVLTNE
jgi:hypothetical protein